MTRNNNLQLPDSLIEQIRPFWEAHEDTAWTPALRERVPDLDFHILRRCITNGEADFVLAEAAAAGRLTYEQINSRRAGRTDAAGALLSGLRHLRRALTIADITEQQRDVVQRAVEIVEDVL